MYEKFQFCGNDPLLKKRGIYYIKLKGSYSRNLFKPRYGIIVSIYTTKKQKIMDCPYDTLTAFLENWKKV